jgi:hypothetical protein
MKRKDIDMVHVIWEPDYQGVVSLKQNKWIIYAWGKFGGRHAAIPTVCIEDSDFRLIMKPVEDNPDRFEASWNDVTWLLNHPRFPLMKRVEQAKSPC